MASIEKRFEDEEFVLVTNIDDLGQPYTCEDWGEGYSQYTFFENSEGQECNEGSDGCNPTTVSPIVVDDGSGADLFSLFRESSSTSYPILAVIDHQMVVRKLFSSCNESQLIYYIQQALDDM